MKTLQHLTAVYRAGRHRLRVIALRLHRSAFLILATICCAALFGHASPAQADVQYVYDAAGRLTVVYAPSGDAAQYVYDPAGNIIQINRFTASNLSVIEFSPLSGPVGTTVTVYGTGFNATPASNTVKFNGTVATVSSGTTSQLVVTVPAGATTGPISVTNGANTATSAKSFTVTQPIAGAPTITSFSPTIGTSGTAVTINGTNFDPLNANDIAKFNQTLSWVTAATTTTLTTSVPNLATSGRISVRTPTGAATSVADFFIPPAPFTAASVGATGRLVPDGASLSVNLSTGGKIALLLFDGNSGDLFDAQFSSFVASAGSVTYTLYGPTGVSLASGTVSASALTAFLPSLPAFGTYTLLVNPGATGTASFSVALKTVPPIVINGASVNATTPAGKGIRFKFAGTVGVNLGLGMTGLTDSPASGAASTLSVYRPDGVLIANVSCLTGNPGGGCGLNLPNLAQAGTYWVIVTPPAGISSSATLTLSSDVTGTLANNTPLAVSIPRSGQNARLTFSGTAGQLVGLELTQLVTAPAKQALYMYIYKPGGTTLVSTNSGAGDGEVLSATLPTTGTYTVFLDANYAAISSFTLTLNPPGELTIDGPPLNITTLSGESHTLSFVAPTAGVNLGLGMTGLTDSPASASATWLYVYRGSDGALISSVSCLTGNPGGGCGLNLPNLAQAGTYWVIVTPPAGISSSATLTLSSDVTGTLANNTPLAVSIPRSGQNARLTFTGTTGEVATLTVSSLTTVPASQTVVVSVYKPAGTLLASGTSSTSGITLSLGTLATTGAYTVLIDPSYAATASMSVTKTP